MKYINSYFLFENYSNDLQNLSEEFKNITSDVFHNLKDEDESFEVYSNAFSSTYHYISSNSTN